MATIQRKTNAFFRCSRRSWLIYVVETGGIDMTTQVGKWGNSLAVRIPGTYVKELELQEGSELEVTRVHGGLLLRPQKPQYTLHVCVDKVEPGAQLGQHATA